MIVPFTLAATALPSQGARLERSRVDPDQCKRGSATRIFPDLARQLWSPSMAPTSMVNRLIRSVYCAACVIAVLGTAVPAWSQSDPLAQAFIQRDAEFRAIRQGVATAQEKLDYIAQQLDIVETSLESRPDIAPSQQAGLFEQLDQARVRVQGHGATLRKFREYADKAARATDVGSELETLTALRGDDLSALLRALNATAEQYGATSIATAGEAYGKAATDIVVAIDELTNALNVMRAQAQLRSETYGGANDPRYRQLAAQWGQAVADAATYAPSSPWEIFRPRVRPTDKSLDFAFIWDDQENEWYRVDGSAPVETIFHDAYIGLGRRPTPGKLKYLADNFGQVKGLEAAANAIAAYLSEAGRERPLPQNQALARSADRGKMLASLAASFPAKFVYDATFRSWTLDVLDQLRQDLVRQGAPAERSLQDFDALLRRHGVTLESQWAHGILPATGTVRVVAWFSDNPKNKFTSTWRFEREKVTIDVNNGNALNNGHAHGTRNGNVVQSERSIPGRNCIASDERIFREGGRLTFSSVYVCTLDDGSTHTNNVSGAGTWQLVSPPTKAENKPVR